MNMNKSLHIYTELKKEGQGHDKPRTSSKNPS